MSNYYLTGDTGEYKVKREGADRASGIYRTKREAESAAKDFCRKSGGGEVRIQGKDGRFVDSDTVPKGNDPCPPRDKVM